MAGPARDNMNWRTVPSSSFHPDQSQPPEPPVLAGKCKNPTEFNPKFKELDLPPPAAISGDQGETLPNFRRKVPVFSEWARHRGDVRNSKGSVSDFGKIRGGSFQMVQTQ
ncbi:hypothetical protein L3X38_034626 [Prunus dulcis]|uniref:Uncharacterized protein n=1 Tax=Prunus dulcis TaxID=3755 RepID=A0AAD4YX14_PRUDU|nr:hypothetical protein L3X38_034626 [Prunus dulcis]